MIFHISGIFPEEWDWTAHKRGSSFPGVGKRRKCTAGYITGEYLCQKCLKASKGCMELSRTRGKLG